MGVYTQIVEWSTGRSLWQRDALRRLAQGGPPSPAEIATWVQMSRLEAQQLPCGAVPLAQDHVPAEGGTGESVRMSALSNFEGVNAIANDQRLEFAETGLTAIYGDNGAGKSGYARIIKVACHARGAPDPILANVFSAAPAVPAARLHFRVGGADRTFDWRSGTPSPEDLGRVAVFDSLAATALLEQDNEVLWTPGGLDRLLRLVDVVKAVKQKLAQEETSKSARWRAPEVPAGTTAAQFVAQLSAATTPAQIDALRLTGQEETELADVEAALKAPDPLKQARQLDQQAARVKALHGAMALLEGSLTTEAIDRLKVAWKRLQDARTAEQALATTTFSDSAVPGVGTGPWGALWKAAEAFAAAGATSDRDFPASTSPSLCVLCQQPVTGKVRDRLDRFHAFVRSDVARQREAAAAALKTIVLQVQRLGVPGPARDPVINELRDLDPENAQNFPGVLTVAAARKATIVELLSDPNRWPSPEPLPAGWAAWLLRLVGSVQERAKALRAVAKPEERRRLQVRAAELASRRALYGARPEIEKEIARLRDLDNLAAAKKLCAMRGITEFSNKLTKEHVSDRMMGAFAEQAKALRIDVEIEYGQSAPREGRSFQRIQLHASGWAAQHGPSRVLSEGERRAVSLAAFLAELAARGDKSGVVLDDPVSSLDHRRRGVVALRLAECAKDRQVVVFTHDLVFLHMLRAAAAQHQVTVADREIRRAGPLAGYCRDKAPAKAMKVKALVGELKVVHQRCAAQHRAGEIDAYEQDVSQGYGLLREAWERAVEELLFNQAVMRFDHRVQTQRLKKVHDICQADLDAIDAGMTTCSKWLPGHAQATAINEPLPEPPEFLAEIERFEDFVRQMRQRGRN